MLVLKVVHSVQYLMKDEAVVVGVVHFLAMGRVPCDWQGLIRIHTPV